MTKVNRLITFAYASYLFIWTVAEIAQVLCLFANHNLAIFHYGSKCGITDFISFYIAGKIADSPQRTDLLNTDIYKSIFESVTNSFSSNPDMRIYHLPILNILMIPFSRLPVATAHLLFIALTTAFGLWSLWLLLKESGSGDKSYNRLLILGILASNPCWRNWTQGQIMWLYTGLVAGFIRYFFNKQSFKAGIALALSSIKPQYVLYLGVPALIDKRWRLLLFAALVELIFILICCQVFGVNILANYSQSLSSHELTSILTNAPSMNCLRAFFCLFLSSADAYRFSLITNFVSLLGVLVICFFVLRKDKSRQTLSWLFSFLILVSLLFSPHAHIHDCLLIAIPALLTLPKLVRVTKLSPTLLIWKWCLYTFPISSWLCFWLILLKWPGNLLLTIIVAVLAFCSFRQVYIKLLKY